MRSNALRLDLTLRVQHRGRLAGYQVEALDAHGQPVAQWRARSHRRYRLPTGRPLELAALLRDPAPALETAAGRSLVGMFLFDWLFDEAKGFGRVAAAAEQKGRRPTDGPVRIRLCIDPSGEGSALLRLPWRLLAWRELALAEHGWVLQLQASATAPDGELSLPARPEIGLWSPEGLPPGFAHELEDLGLVPTTDAHAAPPLLYVEAALSTPEDPRLHQILERYFAPGADARLAWLNLQGPPGALEALAPRLRPVFPSAVVDLDGGPTSSRRSRALSFFESVYRRGEEPADALARVTAGSGRRCRDWFQPLCFARYASWRGRPRQAGAPALAADWADVLGRDAQLHLLGGTLLDAVRGVGGAPGVVGLAMGLHSDAVDGFAELTHGWIHRRIEGAPLLRRPRVPLLTAEGELRSEALAHALAGEGTLGEQLQAQLVSQGLRRAAFLFDFGVLDPAALKEAPATALERWLSFCAGICDRALPRGSVALFLLACRAQNRVGLESLRSLFPGLQSHATRAGLRLPRLPAFEPVGETEILELLSDLRRAAPERFDFDHAALATAIGTRAAGEQRRATEMLRAAAAQGFADFLRDHA